MLDRVAAHVEYWHTTVEGGSRVCLNKLREVYSHVHIYIVLRILEYSVLQIT